MQHLHLGMYNPIPFSSVMFRRAVYDEVGGFRVEDPVGHDVAFFIRVAVAHPGGHPVSRNH